MDRAKFSLWTLLAVIVVAVAMIALIRTPGTAAQTNLDLLTSQNTTEGEEFTVKNKADTPTVYVRVMGSDGKLTEPVKQEKVVMTDAEWKEKLSEEEFRISRKAGTERAGTGELLKNKETGVYTCVSCGLPLYSSDAKFESGTGWPSFYDKIAEENVLEKTDVSLGMARTEVLCARCGGHLGHVFNDGPQPTGLRHCLNSASLNFVPEDKLAANAETAKPVETAKAVFAGGCFWCVEAVFEEIDGVVDVISGYAGGDASTANYKAVSSGSTKHAEVVEIVYDPEKVPFETLLRVHFATHDPTTLNRQGNDVGPQYRSSIFYADDEQKKVAEAFIADLESAKAFDSPIVTKLEPLEEFHKAEEYHQNYVCRNPMNPYVRSIALPKVEKLRKTLNAAESK